MISLVWQGPSRQIDNWSSLGLHCYTIIFAFPR
jgi:hypothetical protein